MSNLTFFRGPWEYDGIEHIHNKDGICVANVSHSTKLSLDSAKANYKLMAAAPDLLNALEILKQWVGQLEDWKGCDPPTEIVDAAIIKAIKI